MKRNKIVEIIFFISIFIGLWVVFNAIEVNSISEYGLYRLNPASQNGKEVFRPNNQRNYSRPTHEGLLEYSNTLNSDAYQTLFGSARPKAKYVEKSMEQSTPSAAHHRFVSTTSSVGGATGFSSSSGMSANSSTGGRAQATTQSFTSSANFPSTVTLTAHSLFRKEESTNFNSTVDGVLLDMSGLSDDQPIMYAPPAGEGEELPVGDYLWSMCIFFCSFIAVKLFRRHKGAYGRSPLR
jgi:hypothetical protein